MVDNILYFWYNLLVVQDIISHEVTMLLNKNTFKNGYLLSFFIAFAVAMVIFVPFIIIDKGFFLYCGDFNSQQIPFYSYANDFIKQGGLFSWETDLGSGFLQSYSFYMLGSPTFWLTLLFPASFVPYLMAPFLALKIGICSLGCYTYSCRYLKDKTTTLLASFFYAFSGFTIYNIFFNHFLEPIMLFPFLLWAMDKFFIDKKRFLFGIFVALNLLNSYFFFAGQVVFCAIYFIVKLIFKQYKTNIKEFILFLFEGLIGCLIPMFLFLPSAIEILTNPRALKSFEGYDYLIYKNPQQYFAILKSVFLPPDPPYFENIFQDAIIKWTSLSAYLPLIGFSGALCYFKNSKNTAFKTVLYICIGMAFVPFLNSAFYAFNSSYYARWFYMPVLILSVISAYTFKKMKRIMILKSAAICLGISSLFSLFLILPNEIKDKKTNEVISNFGVSDEPLLLLVSILFAVLGLVCVLFIYKTAKSRKKATFTLTCFVVAFALVFSISHISIGKFPQYNRDKNYVQQTNNEKQQVLQLIDDPSFYRLNAYETFDNIGLWFNTPTIQTFNSTVNPNILNFYQCLGIKRSVSSKPSYSNNSLISFLSGKYLIMPSDKLEDYSSEFSLTGYTCLGDTDNYTIFKNQNSVNMGINYEYYFPLEKIDDIPESSRSKLLLNAIILSAEQSGQYSHLKELPKENYYSSPYPKNFDNIKMLNQNSCTSFVKSNNGFTAKINLKNDNLVLFQMPFDKGFNALVNGEKVAPVQVYPHLLAIPCVQGENDIVVTYTPVGLKAGILATVIGLFCYISYAIIYYVFQKRKEKN